MGMRINLHPSNHSCYLFIMKYRISVGAHAATRSETGRAIGANAPLAPRHGSTCIPRIVALAFALLLAVHSGVAAIETWTDTTGQSLSATYSGMEKGMAVFVTADGKRIPVAPDKLDADSQKRLKALQAKADAAKPKGLLQTIELPSFDMTVSGPRGTIELQPKLGGVAEGESIKVALGGGYKISNTWVNRKILGFSKDPVIRPDGFLLSLNFEDGVKAELYGKAEKSEVVFGFKVVEPSDIKNKAKYLLSFRIPPILKYDEATSKYTGFMFPKPLAFEDLKSKLAGIELTAKLDKERFKYSYSDSIPKLFHDAESARIAGCYGVGTAILFESAKQGILSAYVYPENQLFGGYSISYGKVDQAASADQNDQLLKVSFGAKP